MQWSSQSSERWGLEQVSVQGEPHSRCCMLKGQVWAATKETVLDQGRWVPS
jgi:hypothetical protein